MNFIKYFMACMLLSTVLYAKKVPDKDIAVNLCGYPDTKEAYEQLGAILTGYWFVTNLGGYATAGGLNFPLAPDPSSEVEIMIYTMNGQLIVDTPKMKEMDLHFTEEAEWRIKGKEMVLADGEKKIVSPPFSSKEIELLAQCKDINMLPRLVGLTTVKLDDGQTMVVNFSILVLGENMMHGIMEFSGVTADGNYYFAKRAFSWTREEDDQLIKKERK